MNPAIRGTLFWQAVAGLAGSTAVGVWLNAVLMLSLAYGVLMAMLNSFCLAARCQRAGEADKANGQRLLYTGAVLRFLGVLAALLLAYGLGLHLLAVAGGMLLAQIALFAYAASHASGDVNAGLNVNEGSDRE
ncbi:MAG: ATP synthase subunit I [Mariprofundaceae bacterium]|nr:ATP synthase subunit I [Mariprofundaceae bacterium]